MEKLGRLGVLVLAVAEGKQRRKGRLEALEREPGFVDSGFCFDRRL